MAYVPDWDYVVVVWRTWTHRRGTRRAVAGWAFGETASRDAGGGAAKVGDADHVVESYIYIYKAGREKIRPIIRN